jgi:hypothetical protein
MVAEAQNMLELDNMDYRRNVTRDLLGRPLGPIRLTCDEQGQ